MIIKEKLKSVWKR